ncbi:MAG: DUF2283 domain-containing protein [Gemmatimonadota bacterium]|nr:DUF2283 domain-containing protein [Gemmatimonadota bacterium]
MKIYYDRDVDALYISLTETTVTTDIVEEGIALDYDEAGQIAGVEILDAGKRLDELRMTQIDAKSHLSKIV